MDRDSKGRFVRGHSVSHRLRDKLGRFISMDNQGDNSITPIDRYSQVVKQVDEFLKREKMKVAIYCRVSKEEQNPENQKLELLEYVKNHPELELYKIYEDKISGVKDSRSQLDLLMQDARAHKFDHVVVWSVDRLGRSPAHFFQIVEEWRKLGITFSITSLGIDTSTPIGRFVTGILSQVAELERQFIVERINLSLKRAKREIETKGYYITKSGRKITKLGRPKGRKDSKPRRKSGYYQRWANLRSEKISPHFSPSLSKENV